MDETTRQVLAMQTWVVVGCSPDPLRDSHSVAAFLQARGKHVIPVNPAAGVDEILGEPVYPSVNEVPGRVDVVDVFRRSDQAGVHVDEAIGIDAQAVWLQLGVIDEGAAQRARDAGLLVVMDRCPKLEWR
jgi:uncharacterized protein